MAYRSCLLVMLSFLVASAVPLRAEGASLEPPRLAASETPLPPGSGLTGGGTIEVPTDGAPFSAEPPLEEDDLEPGPGDVFPASPRVTGPPPEVRYGTADLPEPVRATREALIAAARTGETETLRPLIEKTDPPTAVSSLDGGDPIEVLRSEAGDEEGREVLAILMDVLDAGWVRVDAGTPRERYVWPYFARYPFDALTPPQMVELFRVMTAGDFEGMKAEGAYTFFRVEIGADGKWLAFMSGE